jgi:Ca-activated chloride channel homolog
MTSAAFNSFVMAAVLSMAAGVGTVSNNTEQGSAPGPTLRITWPGAETIASGPTKVEIDIQPRTQVKNVTVTVDGLHLCTIERPPLACPWDAGSSLKGRHVRAVALLPDGRTLVDNVHTKNIRHVESAGAEAVLVPVIVTDGGRFVRGLKQQDFQIFENGVAQPVSTLVSENAPLDLVLAIDVSGSMEQALDHVKPAVKQLLSKLRPGDAATILGFNDTTFIAAEREKDRQVREDAVDLLTAWGGTALYDATVTALDLVSRDWGRRGVVIFSDGDDRHSLTRREAALARVQASDAMLYTIGFGGGASVPHLRNSLETYARATGGKAFFPSNAKELDAVFDQIVTELGNQYVLSYSSTALERDSKWRNIKVQVRKGKYAVSARRGYFANRPRKAGR